MPAYKDPRTDNWYFKKQIRLPDGASTRIRGVPTDYDQPNTKIGALEAERIAIARLRATGTTEPAPPPAPPPMVPTVAEYAPRWFAEAETSNAEATIDQKRSALKNHILPAFGHLRLDEVTFTHVNEWRQRLLKPPEDPATGLPIRKPLDPVSVDRLLGTFHALMGFAVANDVIARLPKKWPKVALPKKLPVFLTFEQADRLIDAPQPPSPKPWSSWKWRVVHAMLVVAIRTGLRHGELVALRWHNVLLDKGVLWVRESISRRGNRKEPKGKKDRMVPLTNDAIRALRSVRQDRWESVFTIDGSLLQPHETADALRLMCRSAKMMPVGWHKLRHTFASHLVMRGVNLVTVMKYMGHVNIRDTLRYSHLSPEVEREAIMVLDEPPPSGGGSRPRREKKRQPNDRPVPTPSIEPPLLRGGPADGQRGGLIDGHRGRAAIAAAE